MKKIILAVPVIALLVCGVVAYANEGQTSASTELRNPKFLQVPPKPPITNVEMMEGKKASSTGQRDDFGEKNASSTRDKLFEIMMRKVRGSRFNPMIIRFAATIDREASIMLRLNSRISKIKAGGADTTASEKFVGDAKIHLDLASSTLETLKGALATQIDLEGSTTLKTSSSTLDSMKNLRKITQTLEGHLKDAQKALESAVRSLMSVLKPKVEASKAPETNTQN